MKYPATFRRHIRKLSWHIQKEFCLREWDIDIHYMLEPKDGRPGVAAEIRTDHTYFNATITIYPRLLEYWKDTDGLETIKETLVHEFCHILTDPLYKVAIDSVSNSGQEFLETLREQQTQHIANIVKDSIPNIIKPKRK